jgi:hypothetical protein
MDERERVDAIRRLNDALRQHQAGGQVLVTRGLASLGPAFVLVAVAAVSRLDSFDEGNDPYEEHDFGRAEVAGEQVLFKIDYYDPTLSFASADPSDPTQTVRVMIIMLASEY